MIAAGSVHIDDLRAPVLTGSQQAALTRAAENPVELTSSAVLDAAVGATGLSDFGRRDFRERLDIWLADAAADTDLTHFGRAAVHQVCVRFASTRLRTVRLLNAHPEIEREQIEAPIIVIGLPRSGTTHLVNLLATDPRRRSLPYWEALEPAPDVVNRQVERVPDRRSDPRRERCARGWEATRELLPLLELMHPFHPDHIHEDLELQGPDFSSYFPEWLFRAPRWREHYVSHNQQPHYEYLRTMLKMLQWLRGPRQWVLKTPQHLEQIPALLAVFPDARIVITQRDPLASIQSAATMSSYTGRLRYHRVDVDALFRHWTLRAEELLRAAVRDADVIPVGQRCDVVFDDLTRDDMVVATRLYESFGIEFPTNVRDHLHTYSREHQRGATGQVTYDMRADFGVDPDALRTRFAFYFDAYPDVRQEVR